MNKKTISNLEDKLNRLLLEHLIAPPDTTVKLKVG